MAALALETLAVNSASSPAPSAQRHSTAHLCRRADCGGVWADDTTLRKKRMDLEHTREYLQQKQKQKQTCRHRERQPTYTTPPPHQPTSSTARILTQNDTGLVSSFANPCPYSSPQRRRFIADKHTINYGPLTASGTRRRPKHHGGVQLARTTAVWAWGAAALERIA